MITLAENSGDTISQHSFVPGGLQTGKKNLKPTRMFPEIILIGLFVISSVTVNSVMVAAKKPFNKTIHLAVLPMAGFEESYLKIQLLNLARPTSFVVKNERIEEKKCLCETIFRNLVMVDLRGADPVDPTDKEIQDILRSKHSNIYDRYFKAPDPAASNQVNAHFESSYRKDNFTIGGTVIEEFAYPCLAKNRASGDIEEYLVSREYHVPRENVVSGHERIVGSRFIFQHYEEKNETILIAMTDLAVEHVLPPHPKYCEHTELTEAGRSKDLCELPDIQRMRLCAGLFNSKNYTELVRYDAPSAGPECRELNLRLQCDENSLEFVDSTVECQVKKIDTDGNNRPATYFISRGFKPHQFFVSKPREQSELPLVTHHFYSYIFKVDQLKH